jgi:hypothetical protein
MPEGAAQDEATKLGPDDSRAWDLVEQGAAMERERLCLEGPFHS